jgi:3-oxoacyl-[acyl-carrier protein] reductase
MAAFAADAFGGIDILINNAGLLHSTPVEEITEEEWDRISDVNLKAVFFACQAVLPYFKERGGGKIVNMSSLAGRNGGFANGLAYSATKAGIIGLTKGLATRLAGFSVNVNAICPGTTRTDILKSFSDDKIHELEGKIPLGRLGSVDDIANAVCFLCADEASFITGVSLDVNGGMYIG